MENFNDLEMEIEKEQEEARKEREEYLKNSKEDFNINLDGFIFTEDSDLVPLDFETCCCIVKWNDDYEMIIGHWEVGTIACDYDERGAFFDGIGGHFKLEDVVAWKPLENIKAIKVDK